MTNTIENTNTTATNADTWQLNALTEALGDLSLTVSDSLSVGRGSDNDVVLGSKQVSRNHAVLSVSEGQLYVKDLDSSNGTFINDQRIEGNQSSALKVNDTLGFASFLFQVQALDAPENDTLTPVTADNVSNDKAVDEPLMANEPVVEEPVTASSLAATEGAQPVESTAETEDAPTAVVTGEAIDPVTHKDLSLPETEEPVIKETNIDQVLSASEQTPAPAASPTEAEALVETEQPVPATEESTTTEPTTLSTGYKSPVAAHTMQEETREQKETPEAAAFQAEHDKTTKTELQEEADPEVLRAKQAATAQFSGTANLGQSRDLGTQGNNAMDQEINNPAHAGRAEKKSSGGWFIWVFAAVLIIGLALWLFNTGMGSA